MSFSMEGAVLGPGVHLGHGSIWTLLEGCFTVRVLLSRFVQPLQNGLETPVCNTVSCLSPFHWCSVPSNSVEFMVLINLQQICFLTILEKHSKRAWMCTQKRPWVFSEGRGVHIANFVGAMHLPAWLSGKFIVI